MNIIGLITTFSAVVPPDFIRCMSIRVQGISRCKEKNFFERSQALKAAARAAIFISVDYISGLMRGSCIKRRFVDFMT